VQRNLEPGLPIKHSIGIHVWFYASMDALEKTRRLLDAVEASEEDSGKDVKDI
jgi:hypothetical protein